MPKENEITALLRRAHAGESHAEAALIEAVYDELRVIASRYMRRERRDHTLQTTALVNEAYLKLIQQDDINWQGRSHFFATAATLMRRILVDHARKHMAGKRGAGLEVLPIDEGLVFAPERSGPLLDLDEALQRLTEQDPRAGRVIELRFFGGLSMEETAEVLGLSVRTVQREWDFGRSWLRKDLGRGSAGSA